jgi:cystathionine beta-lyase
MRKDWKDQGILVRFNVGLEDVNDLIADIERAMGVMQ